MFEHGYSLDFNLINKKYDEFNIPSKIYKTNKLLLFHLTAIILFYSLYFILTHRQNGRYQLHTEPSALTASSSATLSTPSHPSGKPK